MGRTLLVGHVNSSWRDWLKSECGQADWICLDPTEVVSNYLARLTLNKGGCIAAWRFYGSLDPKRYPQVTLAALARFLNEASPDAVVQLFKYQPNPVLKHTAQLIAQMVQPTRILIAKGTEISLEGWPVGPEEVEPGQPLPDIAIAAQRKASWLKLLENCEEHEIPFSQVEFEGARLGSGTRLSVDTLEKCGLPRGAYAEVCGRSLFVVYDEEIREEILARALDTLHASTAHTTSPASYEHLLCSFAKQDGEDFGMGIIERTDFAKEKVHARCTAVPVAPVRILRLGALRIDAKGNELGELRPWQV